jgi:hypothetical protein
MSHPDSIQQDRDRSHNLPPLGNGGKKVDTGLKKAAIADWNSRLVVNTEKPATGSR